MTWMPCSKKMPAVGKLVIVTCQSQSGENRFGLLALWSGEFWYDDLDMPIDDIYGEDNQPVSVIAWMAVPALYEEGS